MFRETDWKKLYDHRYHQLVKEGENSIYCAECKQRINLGSVSAKESKGAVVETEEFQKIKNSYFIKEQEIEFERLFMNGEYVKILICAHDFMSSTEFRDGQFYEGGDEPVRIDSDEFSNFVYYRDDFGNSRRNTKRQVIEHEKDIKDRRLPDFLLIGILEELEEMKLEKHKSTKERVLSFISFLEKKEAQLGSEIDKMKDSLDTINLILSAYENGKIDIETMNMLMEDTEIDDVEEMDEEEVADSIFSEEGNILKAWRDYQADLEKLENQALFLQAYIDKGISIEQTKIQFFSFFSQEEYDESEKLRYFYKHLENKI